MRIVHGDLWAYYERGVTVVVTTNQVVKRHGGAVMGAGVAKQAAERFPELPLRYAESLARRELFVWYPDLRLICLATKVHFKDPSPLYLIRDGCHWLKETLAAHPEIYVALPPLGCGNGGRDFEREVRPLMASWLTEDRYAVVLQGGKRG